MCSSRDAYRSIDAMAISLAANGRTLREKSAIDLRAKAAVFDRNRVLGAANAARTDAPAGHGVDG